MATELKPLPPRDAIAALFARGGRLEPSFAWQDVWQDTHASMFTVAKSAGFDVLGDIHAGLTEALAKGKTFRDFAGELTPLLQAKGWWGQQPAFDPVSGEEHWSQLGSVRRLQTIFDVNMRVSYAAGHWSSFERNKAARPFLRYVHLENQENPRLLHHLWHNTVLPVDHPWWNTHACPNGWNCHCTLQSLSQRDIGRLQREGEVLKFEAPAIETVAYVNKRTGQTLHVPKGIDPGWAYNPGKAGFQAANAADRLVTAPAELAAGYNEDPEWLQRTVGREFATWFDEAAAGGPVERSSVVVGALDKKILAALADRGQEPQSGAITVTQTAIRHMIRDAKGDRVVPRDLLRRLPDILVSPRAVLRDRRDGDLLYVFDLPGDDRSGKVVVALDFSRKARQQDGRRATVVTNAVRTASIVQRDALEDESAYEILNGKL
jgi:hypothetical protein